LKTVKARSIELKVPAAWKAGRPTSMRAAQMQIPGPAPDAEGAEFVVFYFGGPTGGIRANVERWIGQFRAPKRKVEMRQGKCTAGSYILVDISGTWNKPDGPPFARKTVATPGSRVMNVILIEEKGGEKDYYFLKLSGPDAFVKSQKGALLVSIGNDAESEKAFDLKEAAN
jgi:gluconolactonase